MVTKITDNNNEFYEQLFKEVSDSLENFIKNHISSAKNSQNADIITVADYSSITVKEANDSIITSVEISNPNYTHYIMGEPNFIDLNVDSNKYIAIQLCQAYIDVGHDGIEGLEEYFGIIETITNCINTNYQILPLIARDGEWIKDEVPFVIDANTRVINPPNNNYTYAVSGDDLAETIYFTIDRYFDNIDLSTKNIAVLSQINGQKRLTEITFKDITSMPNMIIFGWPISKILTEKTSGILEFSVRFYTLNGSSIDYSLSTLPAKLNIKYTLDFTKEEDVVIDNASDRAKDLLANANIYGTAAVRTPIFHLGDESIEPIDLDADNHATLSAAAHSLDTIPISYYWTKKDDSNDTFNMIEGSDTSPEYIEIKPTKNDIKKYSIFYKGENKEEVILKENVNLDDLEGTYYRNGSKYTAGTAGSYQCVAKVTRGIRSKTARSAIFEIPGPAGFTMSKKEAGTELIYIFENEDEKTNLDKTASKFNTIIMNTFDDNADPSKQTINSTLISTGSSFQYQLSRTNTRNNVSTDPVNFDGVITIYDPIPKPEYEAVRGQINDGKQQLITIILKNYDDKYMNYTIQLITDQGAREPLNNGEPKYIDTGVTYNLKVIYSPKYPLISGVFGKETSSEEKFPVLNNQ